MPKYDAPYTKKPVAKKYPKTANPEEAAMESADKILTFGNMSSYK